MRRSARGIWPRSTQARQAYTDVTNPLALIHIIGTTALPAPCTVGEKCDAEYFLSPLDTSKEDVSAVFLRGSIVVETASDAPAAQFTSIKTSWQADIYSILAAAAIQAEAALAGSGNPSPPSEGTSTPTATETPTAVPPTAMPTQQPLFVTVSLGHHSVKVGKQQTVSVKTLPGADIRIVDKFPHGEKTHDGVASVSGTFVRKYRQPTGSVTKRRRTVHIGITVSLDGQQQRAGKTYKIG